MSASDVAIKVEGVAKTFKLPHERHASVKSAFINFYKRKKGYEKQQVLNNVSFEINKGEFFGIVGRNGSGKSTLLKLLAGIYTPDEGSIQINGKLTPFIELGVGFNPELSGRENVFLNGALLGFSRQEMEAMYDEIVEFAELERFMDQKLKNYSSGMQVRLAFSIAIRANTDILILDEVLAVGDESFQKKCFNYFAQLKREQKTVVLVTHDMEAVKRFCTRAMLISEGKIIHTGKSAEIAEAYRKLNEEEEELPEVNSHISKKPKAYKDASIVTKIYNKNSSKQVSTFNPNDEIIVELEVTIKNRIENAVVGITIEKSNLETVFAVTTESPEEELPEVLLPGTKVGLKFSIQNIFGEDIYTIDSAIVSKDRTQTYFREDGARIFRIQNWGPKGWLLHPTYKLTREIRNE